jgi:GxxExxY protein
MQISENTTPGKLIYENLTYLLNGICFEAHNQLGRFSREKQYGDYIQKRLREENLNYNREFAIGNTGNTLDFVIENKLILELKAKSFLTKADYYQIQRYLQITGLKLGILVNFRDERLKPRRIIKVNQKQTS